MSTENVSCPSLSKDAGVAAQCEGCPGAETCKSTRTAEQMEDEEAMDIRMRVVNKKLLVLSGKGGVGKSSIAVSLSLALASRGLFVGLCDLDICGPSVPHLLGITGERAVVTASEWGWIPCNAVPNLSGFLASNKEAPVMWRGPRKDALIRRFLKDTMWGKLDYLIFDTPPGTSDEHLSIVSALVNRGIDGAILITGPQQLSLSMLRKEYSFCVKMGVRVLGVIENMSGYACGCCGEVTDIFPTSSDCDAEAQCKLWNVPFLGSIPMDPEFGLCSERGQQFPADGAFAKSFASVTDAVARLN